jgi:hypothetical protein
LGAFRFWSVADGSYTITPWWLATNPVTANPATNGAVGLPAVPTGTVRGTAWHDGNGDGIRQPWETPLAGLVITLDGETEVTDRDGRFAFYAVPPGTYALTANLPAGLTAQIGALEVHEGRGIAAGIAAAAHSSSAVYLPLVFR